MLISVCGNAKCCVKPKVGYVIFSGENAPRDASYDARYTCDCGLQGNNTHFKMAHESSGWFLFLGIFVHIFYLSSVFHIYFKSPIIPGLKKVAHATETPAKRLVLILTDGLQAEKAFHRKYEENTKFLRSVIKDKGVWGVSHTRVPTESRVGHVSLIAGTYEDVSAITNGI